MLAFSGMVQKHELRGQVASLDEHIIKIQPMHCEKHQVRVLGSLPRCTGLGMATRRYQASQLLLTARVAECHFVAEFGKNHPSLAAHAFRTKDSDLHLIAPVEFTLKVQSFS
ncbi:hypothetical protein ABIE53_005666 [Burkholderia sp. OAS925]